MEGDGERGVRSGGEGGGRRNLSKETRQRRTGRSYGTELGTNRRPSSVHRFCVYSGSLLRRWTRVLMTLWVSPSRSRSPEVEGRGGGSLGGRGVEAILPVTTSIGRLFTKRPRKRLPSYPIVRPSLAIGGDGGRGPPVLCPRRWGGWGVRWTRRADGVRGWSVRGPEDQVPSPSTR